jgi:hypothetical protein
MDVKIMMGYIVYAFIIGLVAVFYLFNKYQINNDRDYNIALLKKTMPLVGALGVLNFARYTIFSGSMGEFYSGSWQKEGKLYEFNIGLTHLSFCLAAVMAYLNDWNIETERAILALYVMFLTGTLITHIYAITFEPHNIIWRLMGIMFIIALIIPLYQIAYFSI